MYEVRSEGVVTGRRREAGPCEDSVIPFGHTGWEVWEFRPEGACTLLGRPPPGVWHGKCSDVPVPIA